MIKYVAEDTSVVFSEIPNEVTLAINISNCLNRCKGCHTPYLQTDIGEELTFSVIDRLVKENDGITCICLMGEGNDKEAFFKIAEHIAINHKDLKLAVYSGRDDVESWYGEVFDYIKTGGYDETLGGLNKKGTNQRLYYNDPFWSGVSKFGKCWRDITYKMQK